MSITNCQIWLTVPNENPDFEDLAKARHELENLGLNFEGRVGIAFTMEQWINFKENASRFEQRFIFAMPDEINVMGFPVTVIEK